MMTELAIAGNPFFDRHINLDNVEKSAAEGTQLKELNWLETLIDNWFSQGNKAKAIDAFNTLLDPLVMTVRKEAAIATLKSLIAEGSEHLISGERDPNISTQFNITVVDKEISVKTDLNLIHDMQKGLAKAGGLLSLTAESLKNDFTQLASGSGALRSPITSAKYFNQSMRGLDLGKDNPDLQQEMNQILDTDVQGYPFREWGDSSKGVSYFMQRITQDELTNAAKQLNTLGSRIINLNQLISDRYPKPTATPKLVDITSEIAGTNLASSVPKLPLQSISSLV
ncbi:hypothetical protein [Shewanella surugensis]|uniref:Virulence factor YopE GAP domain-containing protein n=1 Tax=Shewanella surugensis TaxID=212020 RepID=A0ABT0L5F0_9GAMM|nr:hypothetical protein [Shewanella surugensis]MCL1122906.1 hypothetical protein [Shewanella surugensis]